MLDVVAVFYFLVVVFHVMVVIYCMAGVVSALLFFDSLRQRRRVLTRHRTARTLRTPYFLASGSRLLCDAKYVPCPMIVCHSRALVVV